MRASAINEFILILHQRCIINTSEGVKLKAAKVRDNINTNAVLK